MEFCERLKILRKQNGYTQEYLASLLGVTAGSIGLYEQNRREPDNDTVKKLAKIFGVSADYLLGLDELSDNFTYALYNEETLTEEQKDAIYQMYKIFQESNK